MDVLTAHARTWIEASASAPTVRALDAIYAQLAEEVSRRGPACWASGRCCNFAKTGHRLYCTGLEAAYTVVRLERPPSEGDLRSARERGGCPLQVRNLCGAHSIRPMGCRVYFCDKSATEWQRDLSERTLGAIRDLHDAHAIPYVYAEWGQLLEALSPLVRAES